MGSHRDETVVSPALCTHGPRPDALTAAVLSIPPPVLGSTSEVPAMPDPAPPTIAPASFAPVDWLDVAARLGWVRHDLDDGFGHGTVWIRWADPEHRDISLVEPRVTGEGMIDALTYAGWIVSISAEDGHTVAEVRRLTARDPFAVRWGANARDALGGLVSTVLDHPDAPRDPR